jgi:aspartate aminotransferase
MPAKTKTKKNVLAVSKRAAGMQASPIRRLVPLADAAKTRGTKVYHLNIGQPDIVTPKEIMDAVRGFKEEVLAYGPSQGLLELRQEMKRYLEKLDIMVSADDIMVTTAGSEAIVFALMAIGDSGDEVLVPEPFYTNYNGFASMADMKLVPVPTDVEDGFAMPSKAEFARRITKKTKAILFCSPNNPTGAVFSRSDLEMLAGLAKEKNLWLLADEVYREFIYDGGYHTSILHIAGIEDRAIMLDSISKRFSACGARVGCMVSRNKEIMQAALKLGQARLCPPTIEQVGAIAGYKNIHKYIKKMIAEYQHRRDIVCDELAKIEGAVFTKPKGAFYIMPQLPIDDANKFAQWMLTDFSVNGATTMVAPGDGFYADPAKGRQEIRIAYVLKESDLRKAMQILARGVEAYNGRR